MRSALLFRIGDQCRPQARIVQPQLGDLCLQPFVLALKIAKSGRFLSPVSTQESGSPSIEGAEGNAICFTDLLWRCSGSLNNDSVLLTVCEMGSSFSLISHLGTSSDESKRRATRRSDRRSTSVNKSDFAHINMNDCGPLNQVSADNQAIVFILSHQLASNSCKGASDHFDPHAFGEIIV